MTGDWFREAACAGLAASSPQVLDSSRNNFTSDLSGPATYELRLGGDFQPERGPCEVLPTPAQISGLLVSSSVEGGVFGKTLEAAPVLAPGDCGGQIRTLYCANCGNPVKVHVSCGDRTCPTCRRLEFLRLRRVYLPLISQVDPARLALVTLTLRVEPGDLAAKVSGIRTSWSKLIRHRAWRPVVGGFAVVEVKWSSRHEGAWNVHIHALVEVGLLVRRFKYWAWSGGKRVRRLGADLLGPDCLLTPQKLSDAWRSVSPGGAYIVDISPLRKLPKGRGGPKGALCYVLKYLAKPMTWPIGDNGAAAWDYKTTMSRQRIVRTFGRWHATHKLYRFLREVRRRWPCRVCGELAGWLSEWQLGGMGDGVRGPPGAVVDSVKTRSDSVEDYSAWLAKVLALSEASTARRAEAASS